MSSPTIKASKKSYFQDRKVWFLTAAGLGLVTMILLAFFLQNLVSTSKYYVLVRDLPARTLITPDMLEERIVSSGGQPPTAIDISQISGNEVYTKVDLNMGDTITSSNAGTLLPLTAGLPSDFVVASFTVNPNSAAGGNIKRGDYIDIFFVEPNQDSNLLFQRMLVIETASNLINPSSSDETLTATGETATAQFKGGVPEMYTVGVSQEDAAKLAIIAGQTNLYVVLSSRDSVEKGADPTILGFNIRDLFGEEVQDSGKGTDNGFPINAKGKTDKDGKPVDEDNPATEEEPLDPDENSDESVVVDEIIDEEPVAPPAG